MNLKRVTLQEANIIADRWYSRTVSLLHYGLDIQNPAAKRRKALRLFAVMKERVTALLFIILKARNHAPLKFERGGIVSDHFSPSPFEGGEKVIAMRIRDQKPRSWTILSQQNL